MALLQNGFLQNQLPVHWRAGLQGNNRMAYAKGDRLNQSSAFGNLAATPAGTYPPTAWVMPRTAGDMASRNLLLGDGAVAPFALVEGRNLDAAVTGTGEITGAADLIISMVAAISGSGELNATAEAFLQLSANLAGTGDLSGSVSALASAIAVLTGSAELATTAKALGTLAASINVTGDLLTSSNVAESVWSALVVAFDKPGSMGEALANAGSSGNPWDTAIDGTYTAAEVMRIVAAALAGKATGGGSTTIIMRNIADTADAITMTVDVNGNRSDVVLAP